jgi:soluble lytic murein transglycosylase-like protein
MPAPEPPRPSLTSLARFRRLLACATLSAAGAHAAVVAPVDDWEQGRRSLLRSQALALENGEGIERDAPRAAELYCAAARMGDAESQFNLGWMYANGRGVDRSDATAAFFFHAAAEQGLAQAANMLARVGGPPSYVPDCMNSRASATAALPRNAAEDAAAAGASRTARTALAGNAGDTAAAAMPPLDQISSKGPKPIVDLVKRLAPEYGLHPQLVLSIIETESNFDVVALSPRNAKGLMQLIPETASRFGVRNVYDPAQNVRGGMSYLRWLMSYYQGNVSLVAAAYNAGEGAVNRYLGVPPYAETRAYVLKVLSGFSHLRHPFDANVVAPSPQLASMRAGFMTR